MSFRFTARSALGIVMLVVLPSTIAISDTERELRTQMLRELEVIEELIDRAEAEFEPNSRLRFRYDLLRRDLERVRVGITSSLLPPRPEPRSFPPIEGKYTP